jgi:hypothetical protein
VTYEFVLRGEIGDRFGLLFEGMRLERIAGRTVLTGPVRDQSHLHGVIERIQELGIELVSVNPIPARSHMVSTDTIVLVIHYEGWKHFREGRDAVERAFAAAPPEVRGRIRWLPMGEAATLTA